RRRRRDPRPDRNSAITGRQVPRAHRSQPERSRTMIATEPGQPTQGQPTRGQPTRGQPTRGRPTPGRPAPGDSGRLARSRPRPAGKLPSLIRTSMIRGIVEIRQFARQRDQLIFTFALPIILLLLFGQIFHGQVGHTGVSFRQYFIAGIIASGLMSTTFVGVGVSIAAAREDGTLTRLAGTPVQPAAYFAGKAILAFVSTVCEVAAALATGVALLGLHLPATPARWLTLGWVLVLGSVTCTLLGIAVGCLIRSTRSAFAVLNLPYLVLSFISGV